MAPIIRTEKLRKVYAVGKERVVALNNVDLSIEKGEFCCIVGQSGSGKSTLLNQLAGLEKPTSGKVYIGKHEISKMTENELAEFRQQHLGFIFQSYNLLPTMTAAENVALPLMFKGVDKKTRLARARKELKSMGLLGRANHLPTEMSGGQQQRVARSSAVPRSFLPMSRQETSTPAQASRCCTACWKCPKTAVSRSLWSPTSQSWPSAQTAL